jgi:hypothetical protein
MWEQLEPYIKLIYKFILIKQFERNAIFTLETKNYRKVSLSFPFCSSGHRAFLASDPHLSSNRTLPHYCSETLAALRSLVTKVETKSEKKKN